MRACACSLLAAVTAGCSQVTTYTQDLMDERTNRTVVVRGIATGGGVIGFVAGIPIDIVALPITYAVYQTQPEEDRDAQSVFLFPSFVLWRVGALIAAPVDLCEYCVYRAWVEPEPAEGDMERWEIELDEREMSPYPIVPIHPPTVPRGTQAAQEEAR